MIGIANMGVFEGSCRKYIFSYNFTDRTKLMILFHLPSLGVECHRPSFLNHWKMKFEKIFDFFFTIFLFSYIFFTILSFFLMGTDGELKKYECTGLGPSIPYKIKLISTI